MNKPNIEKMKSRLLQKPPIVNINKLITLYHGTTFANLEKIKTQGITPRGKRKTNWKDVPSKNDLVYLTNCYASYYAFSASQESNKTSKPVVIKLKVNAKKIKMYPDEDFLAHCFTQQHKDEIKYSLKEWSINTHPKDYQKFWKDSLNFMGTVSCDFIPIKNIIGYAVLAKRDFFWCDPSISPINYKIMAREYIYHLEKLKYIPLV